MRSIVVIDPGHGGTVPLGRSTPYGVRSPAGLAEKNVTLSLAQRVAARLGGRARLTRQGDVNRSLADRARLSRELGSACFVSIHAGGGGSTWGGRGAGTWIHSGAGAASAALAEEVRGELERLGAPGGVERGDIAVLTPSLHEPECAACLLEVASMEALDASERFGNPRQLDSLADGLARAIQRYLDGSAGEGARGAAYGRGGAVRALDVTLDLTDFPTGVFVTVPDASAPAVPRQIRQSDLTRLETGWDRMMRGVGLAVEGSDADRSAFRELLRGGLADSPMLRELFLEIVSDDAHRLTMHVGRSQPAIFVDAFQFDPTRGSVAAGVNQLGHHTLDLDDFDKLPRVSGTPRNFMMLRHQNLVHALREARQGVLGDPFLTAHTTAIDAENAYRQEQGQIGALDHAQPTQSGADLRWDFVQNGAVVVFETWHLAGASIGSIDYST